MRRVYQRPVEIPKKLYSTQSVAVPLTSQTTTMQFHYLTTYFDENLIQLNKRNALPKTDILPITPHQLMHPLHLDKLFRTSLQPPLRPESRSIRAEGLGASQHRPHITSNLGTAGEEHSIDGVAFGRYLLGYQSCAWREDPQPFLDHSLQVWKSTCFRIADYGVGYLVVGNGRVDFGLQGSVNPW
jgi:hypothetical protein